MTTTGISRTTDEWEAVVGRQVRELRLRANRTQADIADSANISVSALRNLEHGVGSSLSTLVAVIRALGRTDWLEQLSPPVHVSPMAQLQLARNAAARERQRARPSRPDAVASVAAAQDAVGRS